MRKIFSSLSFVVAAGLVLAGCNLPGSATSTTTPPATITTVTSPVPGATYTMEEVAKHATASDCWLVVDGAVADATLFIAQHPGGNEIIKGCGKDASRMFKGEREHQAEAKAALQSLTIGTLAK